MVRVTVHSAISRIPAISKSLEGILAPCLDTEKRATASQPRLTAVVVYSHIIVMERVENLVLVVFAEGVYLNWRSWRA
jgi:hypothetical protein